MRRIGLYVVYAALVVGAIGLLGCGDDESAGEPVGVAQEAPDEATEMPDAQEVQQLLSAEDWTYPVFVIDCDDPETEQNGCYGDVTPMMYEALPTSEITEQWDICASFPHLKDPYWVAVDYGMVEEARRDDLKLTVYAASGYTDLPGQVTQLENCVAAGADAIVLGAISYDGLDSQVEQYKDEGLVVIDGWNGINTPVVDSHALTDYYIVGQAISEYLVDLATDEGETLNVAVMPGPAGAGWSERTASGVEDGLQGKEGVEVLDVKYGDTGKDQQLQIAENLLQTYPDVDWIVANAVGAEAAQIAIDRAGKTDTTNVVSTYLIPSVYNLIESGKMACSMNDQTTANSRIATDLAVRKLEGKPAVGDVERAWVLARPFVICGDAAGPGQNNLEEMFVREASLFPVGFSPVTKVN